MPKKRFYPLALILILFFPSLPCRAASKPNPRYSVLVSIADQRTYVYEAGTLVKTLICSTGIQDGDSDTPLGDYVINESGQKRGPWFFSEREGMGAKYWVGFIGGTYLFHSVPMDREGRIIPEEAAKLGKPASHGCVRLSLDDAYWFYSTIPDGTPVRIVAESAKAGGIKAEPPRAAAIEKAGVKPWIAANGTRFRQAHTLSCEIAVIRMCLTLLGAGETDENDILKTIPQEGKDPERAFVCDEIDSGRRNPDGSIHWNNYGAHPPVVLAELSRRLSEWGLADRYTIIEARAKDAQLKSLIKTDERFIGAIVWVVGHPDRWGPHPAVNERGMVAGEHVRFIEPALSPEGRFQVWDPETGRVTASADAGAFRELFDYRVVELFIAGK
jgi:hypothetical protein